MALPISALTALGAYPAANPSGYTSNVGTVTSVSGTGAVSGLTLTGSVTTSGNLTLGGTLSLTSGNVTTALGFTPVNKAGDTLTGNLIINGNTTFGDAVGDVGTFADQMGLDYTTDTLPTSRPALSLNFVNSGVLDSRVTFTRGSTATFVGSNGLIQTAAINAPRFDFDPVTLAAKGLLIEEPRTNLLTYSAEFDNASWVKGTGGPISANTIVSPDGATNADAYTWATSTSSYAFLSQTVSATSNIANTFSVWLKRPTGSGSRTIRLTISDVTTSTGNSASFTVTETWQRFAFTRTSGTSTASVGVGFTVGLTGTPIAAVDVLHVYGAQLEAGAFATSYIPTVASQVTRSADAASITGTNFSNWYNQTEGTISFNYTGTPTAVAQLWVPSAVGGPTIADNDGGNNVRVSLRSVAYVDTGGTITTAGLLYKTAFGYKQGDYASSTNAGTVQVSSNATAPTVQTGVTLGSLGGTSSFLNGHIRSIAYYNTRLSNTILQGITK